MKYKLPLKPEPFCIDVRGMTIDQKMHVQDLLFELGYSWWIKSEKYPHLNRDRYTNVSLYVNDEGDGVGDTHVDEHILHGLGEVPEHKKKYLVTLKELEERVKSLHNKEIYRRINFKSEDIFDLKSDLESGKLYYESNDKFYKIETRHQLMLCYMAYANLGNVYRKSTHE